MAEDSAVATAEPNAPLPTEEEHKQQKIDKAAESGDPGSDVQPNAKAAADQLAAAIAPTPAIPARPETATPPVNVAQRQRANLQPLPTDEELEDLAIEGEGIIEIAKKFFFIADDAGEPSVDVGTNSVFLHYPDSSQISVRFEYRPGDHNSVGPQTVTDADAKARNKKFSDAKKVREDRKKELAEAAKSQADQEAKQPAAANVAQSGAAQGQPSTTPTGSAQLSPESESQPQNQPG